MSFPCVFELEAPCSFQPHPTEPDRLRAFISDLAFTAFVPARLTPRALTHAHILGWAAHAFVWEDG